MTCPSRDMSETGSPSLTKGTFRFIGTWKEADAAEDDLFSDFLAGRGENYVAA